MRLFYFDIRDGASVSRDTTGTRLADLEAARHEALSVLAPIAGDALPDDTPCSVTVTVRDEDRQPVFHASLALVEDWI
ncbi:hypothetical protein GQE99_02950 [Maritimibacter sp. DP07]|jgi:hypothetical protein|uniref:DUF6894 domain-containing protein n=1 Tax=Maritimibacter harenae TaxID=2606218 RepID=A0A845M6E5_9RHOB|nr:hypothetical protein [Maritimibacter harenae]MZR11974.1 hypothetical protein [Maritimibacter harenae]